MRGWKKNERIDFNFSDAHDLKPLTDRASEDTVKRRLRERLSSAKQVIVLLGESTKNLYRFIRWEMEVALSLDLPIVAVNINKKRKFDPVRWPLILRVKYIVHVSFNARIIKYALDHFPDEYANRDRNTGGNRHYNESVYKKLGL